MWQVSRNAKVLLQSVTRIAKCYSFIAKCDRYHEILQFYYKVWHVSQNATVLLQSVAGTTKRYSFITKCDTYHKMLQFYYKVWQVPRNTTVLLQCVTRITKCYSFITKCIRTASQWVNTKLQISTQQMVHTVITNHAVFPDSLLWKFIYLFIHGHWY